MAKSLSKWIYQNKKSSITLIVLVTLVLIAFVIWLFDQRIKKMEIKMKETPALSALSNRPEHLIQETETIVH